MPLAAARIARIANFDELTGLGNRYCFDQRVAADIAGSSGQRHLTLLIVNVGRMRLINGVHGPNVGDALLRGAAARLSELCGEGQVFRIGGDKFAALRQDCDATRAREFAAALVAKLAPPFEFGGVTLEIPCSVGIAIAREHGDSAEALMRAADTALFAARKNGEYQVLMYDDAMRSNVEEQLNLAAEIRLALERSEFRLVYQPIITLPDATLRGFEALVRWQHPTRGLVPRTVLSRLRRKPA